MHTHMSSSCTLGYCVFFKLATVYVSSGYFFIRFLTFASMAVSTSAVSCLEMLVFKITLWVINSKETKPIIIKS